MSRTALESILTQIGSLSSSEVRELRQQLDAGQNGARALDSEDAFEQTMLRKGLLGSLPPSIADYSPWQSRKLARVLGKPVSESLIEERR